MSPSFNDGYAKHSSKNYSYRNLDKLNNTLQT